MTNKIRLGDSVRVMSYGEDAAPATVVSSEHNGVVTIRLANGEQIEVSTGDLKLLNS